MRHAPQELRTYFLTFITAQRRRRFQATASANLLLQVLEANRSKARFELYAFVVMPDHVHLLLTPATDVSLEKAVQYIKGGFSFQLKSKNEVWERGYNESRIASMSAFLNCLRYIEQNPVRKRLVASASEYPYSSAFLGSFLDAAPLWLTEKAQG